MYVLYNAIPLKSSRHQEESRRAKESSRIDTWHTHVGLKDYFGKPLSHMSDMFLALSALAQRQTGDGSQSQRLCRCGVESAPSAEVVHTPATAALMQSSWTFQRNTCCLWNNLSSRDIHAFFEKISVKSHFKGAAEEGEGAGLSRLQSWPVQIRRCDNHFKVTNSFAICYFLMGWTSVFLN